MKYLMKYTLIKSLHLFEKKLRKRWIYPYLMDNIMDYNLNVWHILKSDVKHVFILPILNLFGGV